MAGCIDCLHFDICQFNEQEQAVINLKSSYRDISNVIADGCRFFKNKADFVEVKHGEWFVDDFPKQGKKFIICSECRSVIDCNVTHVDENEYDFCPYCGADMRKEGADNG